MKTKTAALFAAALLASACASAPQPPVAGEGFVKMKGEEIRAALVGNSLDGEDKDGEFVIHYPTASTMRIFYQGREDDGVWRIKGDKYCRKWNTFGKGRERCVDLYRSGDRINWVRKGKVTDRSVLVAGNPAGL